MPLRLCCARCGLSVEALVAALPSWREPFRCGACRLAQGVTEAQWRRVIEALQPGLPGVS